jgi:hypothetical protein
MLDARVERNIRDLSRWRLICLVLLIAIPGGSYSLFEKQARRLDALAAHGAITTATVRAVSSQGSATYVSYEYTVGGETQSWSVSQSDAPYEVGQTFLVLYLPENPSFSRPTVDHARASAEAASNRSFSGKLVGGVFAFFAVAAFACDSGLRRLRKRGRSELTEPRAYRRRLAFAGAMLTPFLVLISYGHAKDALRRGESLWPVVLGTLLGLLILGGTAGYILRYGPAQAAVRSARLVKWVAPLAVGVAALRLLVWLVGRP